jgi:hypothetical protein
VRRVVLLAAALAVAAPATAAPPTAGLLVPGQSLGGLRLGATPAQVERAWGRAYGRCTDCGPQTWYFNYFAFQPQGAGVEFRNGRVAAIFTLYGPTGWHTPAGLTLGEADWRIADVYGELSRRDCGGYDAHVLGRRGLRTAFYVLDERLWAFALLAAGAPVCR